MTDLEDLPRPDVVEGAPHPSQTARLVGQARAEAAFLEAYTAGRLHHGWMLTGPRGVGKATLAWRIAAFLLATPEAGSGLFGEPDVPTTLDVSPEHPVTRRLRAGADPGLFVLRRGHDPKTKRLRTVITVDEVRKLKSFFGLSASDGGRRVVIVDAADEMNTAAANALLKLLEEPPARTTLLLVTHQPARLLPTIRSRCRVLPLRPLGPEDLAEALALSGVETGASPAALAELADGSVGEAVRIAAHDGLELYGALVSVLRDLPQFDRPRALALAESVAGPGKEARLDLLIALLDRFLLRLVRTGATGAPPAQDIVPGEGAALAALCADPAAARHWAAMAEDVGASLRRGRSVNLDPAALILDTVFALRKAAA
ncbi:DNA polymerase III subunit delta' [Poseidonocella sedimentorum]|uniref:DNA polymerase-3 subunit delta n=1 Tax=Poseidonocella sedimentorum TaxID=871652 RepID=A0A1I6DIG9_9RHOB|nr:DNA polymerase III subunit delta' [Poseidonocella sedimentorum]SFR05229.1 DNA polymerase-3 subunit delta' [Poseidonocella sedimentorum]